MSDFLTNIGIIFNNLLNWLGQVGSSLITNPIFIIIIAIGLFSVLYYTITGMVTKNKANNDLEQWKTEHPGAYEENGSWVAPLETNEDDDSYANIDLW